MADEQIRQDEIEELLRQAQQGGWESPPQGDAAAEEPVADAAENATLQQDEIESLLKQASGPSPAAEPTPQPAPAAPALAPAPAATATATAPPSAAAANDIQVLMQNAREALSESSDPGVGVTPFRLAEFAGSPASTEKASLELVRDVELDLKIELGRTQMELEDVLKLHNGSVVSLDKLAGDPVDIYANGRLIARWEVLVLNDNFCVRVAELITSNEFGA